MNPKYLNELIALILSIKDEAELRDFLAGMLTPKELAEIPARLQIIKLLKQGKLSQQEIAKKLGVGVATITRGSKEIQKGRFRYVN